MKNMTTKELAQSLDIITETLRYYEKIGILNNISKMKKVLKCILLKIQENYISS